ncbi:MAG: hypothetical protein AB7T49_00670 [Oligoflexales bacterium]
MNRLLLAALVVFSAGCAHVPIRSIRHVGFSDDTRKGKSIGMVTGLDCITKVFGYGPAKELTLEAALDAARKNYPDARYFTDVKTEQTSMQIVVYEKRCFKVTAQGYK